MLVASCGLNERGDFLVGRSCRLEAHQCDEGQVCLPHSLRSGEYADYFCRDQRSFEPLGGVEPPLAYCDDSTNLRCPGALVCNADRVRLDASVRAYVCKRADDAFAPSYDGGSTR
ncbi:MAG: hypothetical protein H6729_09550 [Deltaproteobacteria bacterium]|nr:hypothetical protein [Deltaproteobacteria bacterium]